MFQTIRQCMDVRVTSPTPSIVAEIANIVNSIEADAHVEAPLDLAISRSQPQLQCGTQSQSQLLPEITAPQESPLDLTVPSQPYITRVVKVSKGSEGSPTGTRPVPSASHVGCHNTEGESSTSEPVPSTSQVNPEGSNQRQEAEQRAEAEQHQEPEPCQEAEPHQGAEQAHSYSDVSDSDESEVHVDDAGLPLYHNYQPNVGWVRTAGCPLFIQGGYNVSCVCVCVCVCVSVCVCVCFP